MTSVLDQLAIDTPVGGLHLEKLLCLEDMLEPSRLSNSESD